MNVGEVCSRIAVISRAIDPLADAARQMIDRHVGALVVVDPHSNLRAVGIVTDRDIVRGQMNRGADLFCLTVGDVMSPHPLLLPESLGISEAVEALNERGVRRAPVIAASGEVVGIVSLDDLLPVLSEDLLRLARLVGSQARQERHEHAAS
jgi:CBS domain-containing protein